MICSVDEIKPAKAVLQGAQSFLNEQLPKLRKGVKSELTAIICHDQSLVESTLENKEDLIKRISSIPLEQLSDYVDYRVNRMRRAGEELNQRRASGFHRQAKRLQDFAVTFSRFLHAYSGIISIMQNADLQYGNVAFATLSLLFATIKVKADAEESIHTSILHISDRMPDFRVYQRIYPDRALGLMLSEAYRGIILFAREVTVHFQSPRFAGSHEGETKGKTVLHEREDERVIRDMAKTLNLQNYRVEDMRNQLTEYQHILRHEFGSDRRRQKMDTRHFLSTVDGQYWENPGRKLLLLFGRNEISSSSANSWLSPVAAELAERHFQMNNTIAYESCDKSSTLELTLSRFIFQLLERNPTLIRRAEDFREIDSQISRNGNHLERVEALRMALLRIINIYDGRVYIILNRPDLCEVLPESEESCAEYINTMLSLVKEAKTELKTMVVVRSELWNLEKNRKGIDRADLEIFHKVRLDQGLSRKGSDVD
ncbi:hypothetical protein FHL15_005439 [Xylaria flabelliformis]|uniref:DUF7708 domain-containing protein n=1 Tax=Xylaria flabelliformis TaxID=2512241 RepID=A0A553I0M8_9PEZI|nr:hypothetical protein FHL15_005439 [Xylaria flabelliformis]